MTGTARRVRYLDARKAFRDGGTVLVSEHGERETIPVTPTTVTHTRDTITWLELAELVQTWRFRYPNQRYYVVEEGVQL